MSANASIGSIKATLRLDRSDFEQGLKKAQGSLRSTVKRMEKIGKGSVRLGRQLSTSLTLPIVAVGTAATKLSVDFEAALRKINALVGVSRSELVEMRKEVLKLGPQVGKGPKELADALFFITSAGARGKEALEILKASAQASAAGMGETAVVADAATSAMNAYGSANLNAGKAVSVLVATVREGKAEADTIATSLGRVIPIASELEVSFDQVGAAIAAMTRVGFSAEESATSLGATLSTILKGGTQASREELGKLGLTFVGLQRQLREEGLLSALQTLSIAFESNEKGLSAVFENVRALRGVLALVGKNASSVEQIFLSLAGTTSSDLADAIEAVSDTSTQKFNESLSKLQVAAISFGDAIKGPVADGLADLADLLSDVSKAFASLEKSTQNTVLKTVAFAAILGPLLVVLGGLALVIGPIVTAFGALVGLIGVGGSVAVALVGVAGLTAGAAAGFNTLGDAVKAAGKEVNIFGEKLSETALRRKLGELGKKIAIAKGQFGSVSQRARFGRGPARDRAIQGFEAEAAAIQKKLDRIDANRLEREAAERNQVEKPDLDPPSAGGGSSGRPEITPADKLIEGIQAEIAAQQRLIEVANQSNTARREVALAIELEIAARQAGIDLSTEEGERFSESFQQRENLKLQLDQVREAHEAVAEAIEAGLSPAERLERTIAQIDEAFQNGLISEQEFTEATSALREQLQDLDGASESLTRAVESGLQSSFEGLFLTLIDGSKSAGEAFAAFGARLLATLASVLAQAVATQAALAALGFIKNIGLSILSAGTGATGSGGGATPIPPSFFDVAATGGPIRTGVPTLVGEQGPELIVPRVPGFVIPNDALSGLGGTTVVNVINQGGEPAVVTERRSPDGGKEIEITVRNIVKQGFADGSFDSSLKGGFGLSRRG